MSTQRGESPLITGNGIINPICHIQANDIAVPGAAPPVTAYKLYSVDLDDWGNTDGLPHIVESGSCAHFYMPGLLSELHFFVCM